MEKLILYLYKNIDFSTLNKIIIYNIFFVILLYFNQKVNINLYLINKIKQNGYSLYVINNILILFVSTKIINHSKIQYSFWYLFIICYTKMIGFSILYSYIIVGLLHILDNVCLYKKINKIQYYIKLHDILIIIILIFLNIMYITLSNIVMLDFLKIIIILGILFLLYEEKVHIIKNYFNKILNLITMIFLINIFLFY